MINEFENIEETPVLEDPTTVEPPVLEEPTVEEAPVVEDILPQGDPQGDPKKKRKKSTLNYDDDSEAVAKDMYDKGYPLKKALRKYSNRYKWTSEEQRQDLKDYYSMRD